MARVKIAHLPMNKRRRAEADRQIENQKAYRERQAEKNAPDRKDFAWAALTYLLFVYETNSESAFAVASYRALVETLVHMGFNREQIKIRWGRMVERASEDRRRWRHRVEWDRRRKAEGPVEE